MLGIDRATVLRATEKLHDCKLIAKDSHGGKSHRASYRPNWDRLQAIVADWDARMKTGEPPANDTPAPANIATLRRSKSQDCDVEGRNTATQTLRRNQSKEPIDTEQVETQRAPSRKNWLGRGNKPEGQRTMLLPIAGGKVVSRADAAKGAAERRWERAARQVGGSFYADVIEWITPTRQDAATSAELARHGGGLTYIVEEMQRDRLAGGSCRDGLGPFEPRSSRVIRTPTFQSG